MMAQGVFNGPVGKAKLVFVLLSLAAVGFGFAAIRESRAIAAAETRYVETSCTIEHLAMPFGLMPVSGGAIRVYDPQVRFRYYVDGKEYESDRVAVRTPDILGVDQGYGFTDKYSPGTVTVCYYDPDDPSDAVLLRQSSRAEVDKWSLIAGACGGSAVFGTLLYWLLAGKSAFVHSRKYRPRPAGRVKHIPDEVPTHDPLSRSRAIMDAHRRGYG
jgi:hypothetical protein